MCNQPCPGRVVGFSIPFCRHARHDHLEGQWKVGELQNEVIAARLTPSLVGPERVLSGTTQTESEDVFDLGATRGVAYDV